MSDTPPEDKPELATESAESAAAEAHSIDPEVAAPPSRPVSARGHLNRPAAGAPPAEPIAAAPPAAPTAVEPEPVVPSDEEVAAAVARNTPESAAAGSATVDTASPAESAAPVTAAAEAANRNGGSPATEAYAPQPVAPVFIQRPEAPKKKSNRGFGLLIALAGTVAFAVLWAVVVVLVGSLIAPGDEFLPALQQYFTGQLSGWAPIVAFFVGMAVLIQIVNRARWWGYILGGLVVAVFVYFVYIGAGLIDAHYWQRTPDEFQVLLRSAWVNPFAVLSAVLAREVSVWTGAWLAARSRRLKARNAEAQADYEQQLVDAQNQAVAAYAQQSY
ncbi:hypothetical protein O159_04150 [Leifsonia xyli subsp. cynodontis DSM 46306]|uniref:Uncharacterized protein n=1 Tax=Leifsonia xyli subsp. cynodontis DSM 46306 TaxID=1389489 RepID=U3P6S0_LEIXC|nr:hypothetical protein [Leifsonia xyli]AGW40622.1 hypothetical protein O159_04150 [Leifsonia xyli subsp. cynodontis DSM 46306]